MIEIKQAYTISKNSRQSSTLLIPGFLVPTFNELKRNVGGARNLLNQLIVKFKNPFFKLAVHSEGKIKIGYQENGLDLKRIDFHPSEDDWVQMKLLAMSYNISICSFFVLLLILESSGIFATSKNKISEEIHEVLISLYILYYPIFLVSKIFHRRV